jgi:hypothetical protein
MAAARGATDAGGRGAKSTPAVSAPPPSPAARPAAIAVAPGPELLVSLPDDDEGERDAIVRQASGTRDALARTLGVTPPGRIVLRVHPTTDDYVRATGQSWFTSGAVVNGELHLPPLAVLRERGVLDRTIRHELVHMLTDGALSRRPQWVREGAAIFFAGEPPIPGEVAPRPARPEPRESCPTDAELNQPVSVGALSNAWARARVCFTRQMQSGRSWRDVR